MSEHWYFAYGSNLDAQQMGHRAVDFKEARRARLQGYRLTFNKRGNDGTGKANIVRDPSGVVWGVAYLCSSDRLERMDRYEGIPGGHYRRQQVQLRSDEGEVIEAMTYVAGDSFIDDSLIPSEGYLQGILKGAREHGLPPDYIHQIEAMGLGG
ncbi:gamma-glutamylcyclotransferase family protein [Synechococcus sp. W55.2]|uniref:gamma-glutamylcyclotransferase family protein n=1 Tax=Synechococcus sp. W55.2 TaxID=2964513 RepID=UPI0039C07D79